MTSERLVLACGIGRCGRCPGVFPDDQPCGCTCHDEETEMSDRPTQVAVNCWICGRAFIWPGPPAPNLCGCDPEGTDARHDKETE